MGQLVNIKKLETERSFEQGIDNIRCSVPSTHLTAQWRKDHGNRKKKCTKQQKPKTSDSSLD